MLFHQPVVGQPPKVALSYWELKDERMIRHFHRCPWRIIRRRKNLHPATLSSPRTGHPIPAKAIVTPYLERAAKDRLLNLFARPPPLGGIESRAGLYGRDFSLAIIGESDLAGLTRKRQVNFIGIFVDAVVLARAADVLVEKQPQFVWVHSLP